MIKNLLIFSCDVYHLTESMEAESYGLPSSKVYNYPIQPNIAGAACYYYQQQGGQILYEPGKETDLVYKVYFLPTEDVRENDKIRIGGFDFKLDQPDNKRSHIEVIARRIRHGQN